MTDLSQIDDLIKRAEDEEGPGTETWRLIGEAADLLTERDAQVRISRFIEALAEEQAALHLMREALEGWEFEIYIDDSEINHVTMWGTAPRPIVETSPSLARAILIAVLRARKAMVEG